jgi:hypothetical protein
MSLSLVGAYACNFQFIAGVTREIKAFLGEEPFHPPLALGQRNDCERDVSDQSELAYQLPLD